MAEIPDKYQRPWPPGDGFNQFGYEISTKRQVAALDVAVDVMGVHPMDASP